MVDRCHVLRAAGNRIATPRDRPSRQAHGRSDGDLCVWCGVELRLNVQDDRKFKYIFFCLTVFIKPESNFSRTQPGPTARETHGDAVTGNPVFFLLFPPFFLKPIQFAVCDREGASTPKSGGGALPEIMSIIRSSRNPRLPQLSL